MTTFQRRCRQSSCPVKSPHYLHNKHLAPGIIYQAGGEMNLIARWLARCSRSQIQMIPDLLSDPACALASPGELDSLGDSES